MSVAVALLLSAAQEFKAAGVFRPDRGPGEKVHSLYAPGSAEPEAMRDLVFFARERTLECRRLPNGGLAWSLDLPFGPITEAMFLRAGYRDGRLHLWDETHLNHRAYDLGTGRAESPPDLDWTPGDPPSLIHKRDREGLHFRLRGSDWRWTLPAEKDRVAWHRQRGDWIVIQRGGAQGESPEILIRRVGAAAEAGRVKLPGPAGYGIALAGGFAYLWGENDAFARNRFGDKPLDPAPAFIWASVVVNLESATIVREDKTLYTEELRRQARLTGAYGPVGARRARGIDGLGLLVEEPLGLVLERERPLWRRDVKNPHVIYADADLIGVRTRDALSWVRTSTGDLLSSHPLPAGAAQQWDRQGDALIAHSWEESGIYSARAGIRLLTLPSRPRKPSPTGAWAVNWPYFWDRVSTAGGLAAVDSRLEARDGPTEIRIFDLGTGALVSKVALDGPAERILLKERWLLAQISGGVRVFAR